MLTNCTHIYRVWMGSTFSKYVRHCFEAVSSARSSSKCPKCNLPFWSLLQIASSLDYFVMLFLYMRSISYSCLVNPQQTLHSVFVRRKDARPNTSLSRLAPNWDILQHEVIQRKFSAPVKHERMKARYFF